MNQFIDAMLAWNRKKDEYVKSKIIDAKKNLSPRKNIMLTVPLLFEEEIKAFAKAKRKEADAILNKDAEKSAMAIALDFEKLNPPPSVRDF